MQIGKINICMSQVTYVSGVCSELIDFWEMMSSEISGPDCFFAERFCVSFLADRSYRKDAVPDNRGFP